MKRNYTSIRGAGYSRSFRQAAAKAAPEPTRVSPAAKPQEPRCDRSADAGSTHIWAPGATVGDFCLCGKRKRFTPFASYQRPEFQGSNFKAARGSSVLKKEEDARDETAAELLVKKDVRARDVRCRCPLKHKCRGGLEVIHLKDRSLGGEFVSSNLWLGCKWIHRSGPVTIHSKDIEVRPRTKKGMDGPVEWWVKKWSETRASEFSWKLIATESAQGVIK